jgi:hypothetical protein
MRLICGMALMLAVPAQAVVTADQIERSVHLRDDQKYLTENVADPGAFTADGRAYAYRKTVAGGFQFVLYDPTTGSKAPAFDHARLAEGLGKAMGEPLTADRLPIQRFTFADGGKALQFGYEEEQWRCDLATYACVHPAREKRPSGFGVVRDLAVPADNHPRRSPDGKWEAHVENFNIAVRPVGAAVWEADQQRRFGRQFLRSRDDRLVARFRQARRLSRAPGLPADRLQGALVADRPDPARTDHAALSEAG